MLHGYCIRRAGDPPPRAGMAGIDAEPVRLLETDTVGIWLSAATTPTAHSADRLRQHERVVREALQTATPLPLRYGTLFRNDTEVVVTLRERSAELALALERVTDRVEMGFRVTMPAPDLPQEPDVGHPTPLGSGREYLERRRDEIRAREEERSAAAALLGELAAELSDLDAPSVCTPLVEHGLVGSVAHLVHKASIHAYHERIARLQRDHPEVDLVVSGPWAPYSFV